MKKTKALLGLAIGIFGLLIFADHILGFEMPEYFYSKNPDIKLYVGTNVVSMYADFSFFTYHSLIFFSIWMIFISLSVILSLKKLNKLLRNSGILSFIFLNYIVTAILYTAFELSGGKPTFGLYAKTPGAYHNFGTNVTVHYVYFAICLIAFLRTHASNKECNGNHIRASMYPMAYLFIYYLTVLITGRCCYRILWFPYPIFDTGSFSTLVGLPDLPQAISVILLITTLLILAVIYQLLFILLMRAKERRAKNAEKRTLPHFRI